MPKAPRRARRGKVMHVTALSVATTMAALSRDVTIRRVNLPLILLAPLAFLLWQPIRLHKQFFSSLVGQDSVDGFSSLWRERSRDNKNNILRHARQISHSLGSGAVHTTHKTEQNNVTITAVGGCCTCDIVSTDCLHCLRCLPTATESEQLMQMGILTRKIMKRMTRFRGTAYSWELHPVGKGFQYSVIEGYKSWKRGLVLPRSLVAEPSRFVNETWYPYCREDRQRRGKRCFFGEYEEDEETSGERMDFEWAPSVQRVNSQLPDNVESIMQLSLMEYYNRTKSNAAPALGHLLVFAHIARIFFHRTPPVLDAYKRQLRSIWNRNDRGDNALRVSLHIRRADSCGHSQSGYQEEASLLDSVPQVSGVRMCYKTSVYLKALERIRVETGRNLDVFLATDHAGSILDEIKNEHGAAFTDLYNSSNWHYLNYSRDTFDYIGMVEGDGIGGAQQALIGETAMADLWHLSHGEVFVGHLGSRFGKAGYALATARRNTFTPFLTIDGHSFCCEIDENCEAMKQYIVDMDNCLTFASELSRVRGNKDYWEGSGSLKRKIEAEMAKSKQ